MLGSLHDAEDALRRRCSAPGAGCPSSRAGARSRTWLYRIATNACLDAIARRPTARAAVDYGPGDAPTFDVGRAARRVGLGRAVPRRGAGACARATRAPDARYEQREAVELAFIAALQHLPATQRAVLILREVLGFSAREAAESLDTSVASVNSALQRARRTLADRLPERSQQETLRSLGDERVRELVEAFVDAWSRGDVEALSGAARRGRRLLDAAVVDVVAGRRDARRASRAEPRGVCALGPPVPVPRQRPGRRVAFYERDAGDGPLPAARRSTC